MRQIDEVRKAYLDGCRTSIEVAQRTGLPRGYCSAYTRDLFRSGFLIRVGVAPKKSANGQCIYLYEPSPSYQDALHRPDVDDPERFDRIIELFLTGADEQVNVNALRRAVAAMKEDVGRLRLSVRRLHARRPFGENEFNGFPRLANCDDDYQSGDSVQKLGMPQTRSMTVRPDFSKMRLSELIRFAKEQERIEREQAHGEDSERTASWADTLAALRYMQSHDWPEDQEKEI
jgi:hypothetical protein